jgi:ankyrin repeat protein
MKTKGIGTNSQDAPTRFSTPRRQDTKAQSGDSKTERGIYAASLCDSQETLEYDELSSQRRVKRRERRAPSLASPHLCVFALILFPLCLSAATNELSGALQRGLFEEEANRNLDAAAQAYQAVSAQFDQDRKLAATAIFRLGEVYRKQGKTNEAVAQYERIVREFPDEQTLATLSRQNLTGLGAKPKAPVLSDTATSSALATAESELTSLTASLQQLQRLKAEDRRVVVQQDYPNPVLTELMKQLTQAEQSWAIMKRSFAANGPEALNAKALVDAINKQVEAQVDAVIKGLQVKQETAKETVNKLRDQLATLQADQVKWASTSGDDEQKEIRRIQDMIKNSPDLINAPSERGLTPLCLAASKGQLRVAKFLLDNGAAVNKPSGPGRWTALQYAADGGHKAMVELLAERGADINARNDNGETALHLAAAKGYLSVAEALILRKADINARAKTLDDKYLNADALIQQSSHFYGSHATTVGAEGMTPLQYAVSKGHTEMVKFLISKGAEVDAKDLEGMTALICAAVHGYTEVINTLLSAGAKPDIEDKRGHTALLYVAALGNIDSVKLLLAAKANPNADKAGGLLCWAGPLRHPGCVKLLLEAGAKPDIKQNDGQTPLLTAIERGYYDSAVLLIQHGADLNLANDKQMTPLMMAVWTESPSMVSLLLTNGANVNVRGPAGRTALAMAKDAESGIRPAHPGVYSGVGIVPNKAIDHQIVEILLQHGTSSEPSKK